jgi:glutathione synthase/RimK-type ligase-like ATP-grasp enzyme
MRVGIHKDPYGKFSKFLEIYEEILAHNGIEHIRLEASEPDFWESVSELDLFIFRWRQVDDHHQLAKTIIPIIEKEMRIRCFPDMATCWHYDDKIRQFFLLRQRGFPIIESWIFWDKKMALKWLENATLPVVFKLKSGAGSNNVILVKNKNRARKLINRNFGRGIKSGRIPDSEDLRFKNFNPYKTIHRWGGNFLRILRDEDISPDWQKHKNYVLFQKFLPHNNFDTRITVIGRRAFAFRRFTRKDDFRASGSGMIDYDASNIDPRCMKIGFNISEEMHFQSMAYDFIYNEETEPEIAEISYNYVDTAIYNCKGYFDLNLKWHEGRFWPQYFQLVDALGLPDLKQPQL